ncbi:right-handed parallel beta-helix repeat-containing protein [Sulfuricystis multivorans]|uniref:right-handed parallel beta-helix repeat-containing protein n=1 Tax=Sulfuricystis multivorans TaxID=2211108 RepID=UPI000F829D71|nr:right-handed parallel beta-helix repeat-containing protein [Sulfuricystis multivorans]
MTEPGAGKTAQHITLALFLALTLPSALADTLRVGPHERLTRIAEAARLAKDGDTVEILPGEYRGDVAVWLQKRLTVRGIGQRPVLIADGSSAEGKAIWVIRNGEFHLENLEFRGSRVPAGNGAAIRFEGGRLTVRDCAFIDNQMGILTSNDGVSELVIEHSRFADAPHQMHSLPHLLYVGRIARVEIRHSRFENGFRGHLVKSRARQSLLHDNQIVDGSSGEASYEIDLPNGGIATITGNTVAQSAKTQNPVLISYGAEGDVWPDNALTLRHNVLISDVLPGGWFLRVHGDKFPTPPRLDIGDNETHGIGILTPAEATSR